MDVDVSEEDMMFQAIAMSLRQGAQRASTFQHNLIRNQKKMAFDYFLSVFVKLFLQ